MSSVWRSKVQGMASTKCVGSEQRMLTISATAGKIVRLEGLMANHFEVRLRLAPV